MQGEHGAPRIPNAQDTIPECDYYENEKKKKLQNHTCRKNLVDELKSVRASLRHGSFQPELSLC